MYILYIFRDYVLCKFIDFDCFIFGFRNFINIDKIDDILCKFFITYTRIILKYFFTIFNSLPNESLHKRFILHER